MNYPHIDLNRWPGVPDMLQGHIILLATRSDRGALWLASLPPPADPIPHEIRGPPLIGIAIAGRRQYRITFYKLITPNYHRMSREIISISRRNSKPILIFHQF